MFSNLYCVKVSLETIVKYELRLKSTNCKSRVIENKVNQKKNLEKYNVMKRDISEKYHQ